MLPLPTVGQAILSLMLLSPIPQKGMGKNQIGSNPSKGQEFGFFMPSNAKQFVCYQF
jgi:hypothetical protein